MIYENQAHLDADLAYWQEVLRLRDWRLSAKVARVSEFVDGVGQAECCIVFERKEATISLLDPLDYPADSFEPQDHEVSLVHELLHFHLVFLDYAAYPDGKTPEPFRLAIEQAICSMSTGYVQLRRDVGTYLERPGGSPIGGSTT